MPGQQAKTPGQALTLSSTIPSRTGSTSTYTVTLDPNGGHVDTTSLSATRTTSYTFKNWNTLANGTGNTYAPGTSYTYDSDLALYAQWTSSTSTASVTLPTPWRYGYLFKGWGTSGTAASGRTGSYTPSGNVTLYATWEKEDLSGWSTTKPANVDDAYIETATQYRYSDKTITGGWTLTDSGTIDYVKSWPGGFKTSDALYARYNKSPKTASTTSTKKVEVSASSLVTYIYWHWCWVSGWLPNDNYNVNVWIRGEEHEGKNYQYFTAFESSAFEETHKDRLGNYAADWYYAWRETPADGSWWWQRIPVYRQTYKEYTGSNTAETWSDWSVWTMKQYPTGDSRKAQTRTVYRYTGNLTPVDITDQPVNVTVKEGQVATFTVKATGDELSYHWQYMKPGDADWTNVSKNGTSATYSLTAAAKHDGYTYRCKLTNPVGTVYTKAVKLTVKVKPTIITQPKSVTVPVGSKATFKVVATGATGYRWQYKKPGDTSWTNVSKNGTSDTYSLIAAAKHDGYIYRCKVTNAAGSVYSKWAKLTVTVAKPTITTQPKAVTVYVGKKATFKVVASDADSYKWQYQKPGETSWTNVSSNGTSATYTLSTAVRHNGYTYRCAVKNGAGTVYTDAVKLTVSEKPVITTQPKAASVTAGKKATFKVVADGATGYRWQYKKPGDTSWTNVSKNGASATYTLTTAAKHNGYTYRCKITNDKGTVYTKAVTLTVE